MKVIKKKAKGGVEMSLTKDDLQVVGVALWFLKEYGGSLGIAYEGFYEQGNTNSEPPPVSQDDFDEAMWTGIRVLRDECDVEM